MHTCDVCVSVTDMMSKAESDRQDTPFTNHPYLTTLKPSTDALARHPLQQGQQVAPHGVKRRSNNSPKSQQQQLQQAETRGNRGFGLFWIDPLTTSAPSSGKQAPVARSFLSHFCGSFPLVKSKCRDGRGREWTRTMTYHVTKMSRSILFWICMALGARGARDWRS